MKTFTALTFTLLCFASAMAQINKPKERVESIGTNRANNRLDQSIDKGFNSIEKGIGGMLKKKDKKNKNKEAQGTENNEENAAEESSGNPETSSKTKGSGSKSEGLKSYSKFDFVSGDKVVATEDFAQDAIGDFPAKWNTNATAEVVTVNGKSGKWLKFDKVEGSFYPEYISSIPENATIEFDLMYNNWKKKYAYSRKLVIALLELEKADKSLTNYTAGRGAFFEFDGAMGTGNVSVGQLGNNGTRTDLVGTKEMSETINPENSGKVFHISIWRQKTRLRIYVDELKVFDLPKIFPTDVKLNQVRFHSRLTNDDEQMYISNIRMAVGSPDTRNKLITEGKFVTTGITFDVNSANIKPNSYGVLKDIANTLTENPTVKVKIIGHTDSDGEATKNLELSKKRAEAVKTALTTEFGVSNDRFQTDGKGASVPAQPNTSPEGKANNRRVEFIKL